jgi:hypothetical protein
MGLTKEQLQKNGYSESGSEMRNKQRESGGRGGAPIPRSFGR